MQEKTKRIIKDDYERIQAYARVFDVEMRCWKKTGPFPDCLSPIPGR